MTLVSDFSILAQKCSKIAVMKKIVFWSQMPLLCHPTVHSTAWTSRRRVSIPLCFRMTGGIWTSGNMDIIFIDWFGLGDHSVKLIIIAISVNQEREDLHYYLFFGKTFKKKLLIITKQKKINIHNHCIVYCSYYFPCLL